MPRKRHLRSVNTESVAAPTPGAQDASAANTGAPIEPPTTTGFIPLPSAEELERLLDEESDDEFGETEADVASASVKAVLKDWTAQDFANIYTRYRPHLERHARRWLRNQAQVDEVVQDAFLYLMVTLPELDSEIGVLRFLKWKVKNLCIDVMRASNRAVLNSIDEVAEPESNEPEVGSDLEHAEDAAIVRLALSKLTPRHREVLIASMYEEKSTREVAAMVGLSENATLQLIHRARAAFKKALLGDDVNTEGMSVQAILSVAARKAAQDVKKVGAQAMLFIVFVALAIGAVVNFGRPGQAPSVQPLAEAPAQQGTRGNASTPESATEPTVETAPVATRPGAPLIADTVISVDPNALDDGGVDPTVESPIQQITQTDVFDLQKASSEAFFMDATKATNAPGVQSLYLGTETGPTATLDFKAADPASVTNAQVKLMVGGDEYLVFLPNGTLDRTFVNGNATYTYSAPIKQLIDGQNRVITGSLLNSKWVHIVITVKDVSDKVISTSIRVGDQF